MNTALSWIKAYVPELECTDQEYCDAMTLSGTKVEGFEKLDKNLDKIVVGEILKIERHPANWGLYGRGAGPIRNAEMVKDSDGVVVFWNGESSGAEK